MEGLILFVLIWLIWGCMLLALLYPVNWCIKKDKVLQVYNEQTLYAKICKCRLFCKKSSARHMIE